MVDPELENLEASRMPLMDHLIELRNRLMVSAAGLAVGMVISLYFVQDMLRVLRQPFDEACVVANLPPQRCALVIVSSPFEGVYTWLWTAFLGGVVIAMPVIAWQAWGFIAPGLYKSERRMVYPLSFGSSFLFLLGAGFCYAVLLPLALPFFFTVIPDMTTQLSIRGYLGGISTMMLAFGVCFQLPVVVWFLAKLGLVDHKDLTGGFRYAVVIIFIVAALITPPDPLTQTVLALPLIVLYVFSIGIARFSTTKVRDE